MRDVVFLAFDFCVTFNSWGWDCIYRCLIATVPVKTLVEGLMGANIRFNLTETWRSTNCT